MKYTLNVAHLYGDLLNTYGDIGNLLVLEYYAKKMDVTLNTEIVSIGQPFDPQKFDLAFFGGGQDYEQMIVSRDIQEKKAALSTFIETDGPVLAICGGYQLLGKYYIGAQGERINGIGALPHYTESQDNHRFIGDIVIKNKETGQKYHGFENHNGITFLGQNERPLGDVLSGHGNNGKDKTEGAIYKNVFCSYFHGPILARNGELAKRLLLLALKRKYPTTDFSQQEHLQIKPTY
ncbi:type 1 glutamine amidotransferase [Liquorilactobacillus satsumensis]|uniref:Lipid II isoglutaminyl synthase (glutamine-hydrolyzing) subunit GatD n=1 Tax=Liquorilactobacillus satsumensis DSM 16230 = JCM 12392 TaxID=1423801 RepID=A0A0R1V0Z8_9LACO|nr:glutamine amidotransferase [Liquorilactobacillus satsumensis]KRL97386.1 cobyric acid synthase [Liquorilactobacillus satsumensis DSM 16230 = JCM 12392]MCC7667304.1 glutamine amidotransferase [Liquorilactobacillus satsumensis]MCP9312395.1 glutamine amidotransferase [Liquorilactobacillus satsumensis]MCP9327630.1 glutamine amidotransferase [Liquorilactobacillus satsumensis]MCP9357098.1 glutamine amidotransferase [Liquorilactobacillus satsumensis]